MPRNESLDALRIGDRSPGALGTGVPEEITETTSPLNFQFEAGRTRDIHVGTVLTVSNSTTGSVTETISVSLYQVGDPNSTDPEVPSTDVLLASEQRAVTVAANSQSVETYIDGDVLIGTGTHRIEVINHADQTATGGAPATLAITQTVERVLPSIHTFTETNNGRLVVIDYAERERFSIDPTTGALSIASLDTGAISATNVTTQSVRGESLVSLGETATAPATPQDGEIRYADGTGWNPGSGAGFYGRQEGVWVKL